MGPITIVTPGSNLQTAVGSSVLFSSKNPFTKLDTTNMVSFQTLSILFSSEPTQPTPSILTETTQIYQFVHNYTYIPATWMTWQNSSPEYPPTPPAMGDFATTFPAFGDDSFASGASASNTPVATEYYNIDGTISLPVTNASLSCTVDDTNVYLSIVKTANDLISGAVIPLYLAGVTLNVRIYCFVEPANNSTY